LISWIPARAKRHQACKPCRPRIEPLEDRRLLSVSPLLAEEESLLGASVWSESAAGSATILAETQAVQGGGFSVEVQVGVAPPSYVAGDGGGLFVIDGAEQTEIPGTPMVPCLPVTVLLPPGMTASHVEVSASHSTIMEKEYELSIAGSPQPVGWQPGQASGDGTTPSYLVAEVEPGRSNPAMSGTLADLVAVQHVRGYTIAVLNVYPVQITEAGQVFYSSLDITVQTEPEAADERITPVRASDTDAALVAGMVANPQDLGAYESVSAGSTPASLLPPGDYDYVIITSSALAPSFEPLRLQKDARNVDTVIYTVEDIYTQYSGVDNAE
jgi:hypothetical protein